jgi:uncharacterized protein
VRFEISKDVAGQYIWRLRADNSLIIANGESYVRQYDCEQAISLVQGAALDQYSIYKDVAGFWRWTLRARNNEIIAHSSESYHNRSDCEYSARLAYTANSATPVVDLTVGSPASVLYRR